IGMKPKLRSFWCTYTSMRSIGLRFRGTFSALNRIAVLSPMTLHRQRRRSPARSTKTCLKCTPTATQSGAPPGRTFYTPAPLGTIRCFEVITKSSRASGPSRSGLTRMAVRKASTRSRSSSTTSSVTWHVPPFLAEVRHLLLHTHGKHVEPGLWRLAKLGFDVYTANELKTKFNYPLSTESQIYAVLDVELDPNWQRIIWDADKLLRELQHFKSSQRRLPITTLGRLSAYPEVLPLANLLLTTTTH